MAFSNGRMFPWLQPATPPHSVLYSVGAMMFNKTEPKRTLVLVRLELWVVSQGIVAVGCFHLAQWTCTRIETLLYDEAAQCSSPSFEVTWMAAKLGSS